MSDESVKSSLGNAQFGSFPGTWMHQETDLQTRKWCVEQAVKVDPNDLRDIATGIYDWVTQGKTEPAP